MLRKDLAAALGITTTMIKKLERRGMPLHDVELARRWREANLDMVRTKQYRADGNTGKRYAPKVAKPAFVWEFASPRPGVAEADMHVSAALFSLRFGIERYGPLLIHLGAVMSDDGHDVQQQCFDRGMDLFPHFADDVWEAISSEYFALLPTGCAEAKEFECTGYDAVMERIEAFRAARKRGG